MNMDEKIKWKDVTYHDKLLEYIREVIGEHNLYDELYEDLLHGMLRNREEKKKQEELNKKISNMGGILMPSKND